MLVLGELGTGEGSFWFGINNPNTTGFNGTDAVGSAASGPVTIQTIVLPILIALAVVGFVVSRVVGGR